MPKKPTNSDIYLDLGKLTAMAKININGVYAGGVWTEPYRVNVTKKLHPGENKLEITVVNTWKNRLIGDYRLPEKDRLVQSKSNEWNAQTPLQPSGLLGPVQILSIPK